MDPMDCSLPGSSVHGILQARILEWVAEWSHGRKCSDSNMLPLLTQFLVSLELSSESLRHRRKLTLCFGYISFCIPKPDHPFYFCVLIPNFLVALNKHIYKEQRFIATYISYVLNSEIPKGGSPKIMWINLQHTGKACDSLSKLPCKWEHVSGYKSGALRKSVSLHCNVTERRTKI